MRADWDIEERALQVSLEAWEQYKRYIQAEFDRVNGLLKFEDLEDDEQDALVEKAKGMGVRGAVQEFLSR